MRFSFEGEYARRFLITPVFSISVELCSCTTRMREVNTGVFTNPAIPRQYRGLFVSPPAGVELFPTTAVSPWISLGGGFGHIGEPKNLLYGGINPGKGKTFGVFEADWAGIVRVWKRLSIWGERRDFWSGEPDFH
jgi:hypothetical protein